MFKRLKLLKALPIIGVALFLFLIFRIGIDNLITNIFEINPLYILLALLILAPRTIIYAKKWDFILKKQNINLPFSFVLKTYFISVFYGAVTPGWIGTYIRIPYIKKKAHISLGKSTSNLVVDTIIDVFSVCILVFIGAILLFQLFPSILPIISLLFFLLIFLIFYFKEKKRSEFFLRFITRFFIPKRYKTEITGQFDEFYAYIPRIRELLFPILLCIICWILSYTQIYIIAVALGIDLPYVYFILVYPVVFLVELIPISISGFGTRDLTLVSLFSIFGIAEKQIITLSLAGYSVTVLAPAIIGMILSLVNQKN